MYSNEKILIEVDDTDEFHKRSCADEENEFELEEFEIED